jgi:hypothetical protein
MLCYSYTKVQCRSATGRMVRVVVGEFARKLPRLLFIEVQ